MKKNFISFIKHRSSLEAVKGFKKLRKNNPDLINEIKSKIRNSQLYIDLNGIEKRIYPDSVDLVLTVKQFLVKRLLGGQFTITLLGFFSNGKKIVYPMPKYWISIIESYGVNVAHNRSTILFYFFLLFTFFEGIVFFLRKLIFNPNVNKNNESVSFFFDIDPLCFSSLDNKRSFTLLDWYFEKFSTYHSKPKVFMHSVKGITDIDLPDRKLIYRSDHYPEIKGTNKMRFFISMASTYLKLILLVFQLRWWNILLAGEIMKMELFKFQKSSKNFYWFNNSYRIYRPLWTYIAEETDNKVIFFYYSCHIGTYREKSGYKTQTGGEELMNWPMYLVWNNTLKEYIKSQTKRKAFFHLSGAIWHHDCSKEIQNFQKKTIAVFDVQPYRETFTYTLGFGQSYVYDHQVPIKFLKDIQEIAQKYDFDIAFKRKRAHPLVNRKYIHFLKSFTKKTNVHEIDPSLSPHKLVEASEAVISMPFTSTAQIGKESKKVSIYYDPMKTILKNDRASHKIPVVNGKQELEIFFKKLCQIKK